jgi:hypothetical protein
MTTRVEYRSPIVRSPEGPKDDEVLLARVKDMTYEFHHGDWYRVPMAPNMQTSEVEMADVLTTSPFRFSVQALFGLIRYWKPQLIFLGTQLPS